MTLRIGPIALMASGTLGVFAIANNVRDVVGYYGWIAINILSGVLILYAIARIAASGSYRRTTVLVTVSFASSLFVLFMLFPESLGPEAISGLVMFSFWYAIVWVLAMLATQLVKLAKRIYSKRSS